MHNQNVDLQLVLCPVRDPEIKYRSLFQKIYSCWHQVWTAAYGEAKHHQDHEDLKSDSFTRQDFVAAIFHNNECIAFILFRHADASLVTTQDDSFFTQWSEIHRKAAAKIGQRLLICGNLGVLPTFRQKSLGVSLKDLMGGVISEITLQSNADATLATPRRDRNVHGAAYKWGAVPIAQDISWGFGIQIDLISFHKANLLKHRDHELRPLIDELWQNKIVVNENIFESIEKFKHTAPYSLQNIKFSKKTG
ncbi:MAG: hypothetical protein V4654_01125 [Bdellovibrionota bacterium]